MGEGDQNIASTKIIFSKHFKEIQFNIYRTEIEKLYNRKTNIKKSVKQKFFH